MTQQTEGVDPRGPRFGQALTGSLTLVAFLLDVPELVAVLAVVLGAGSVLGSRFNLWSHAYRRLLRPFLGQPDELEHPAPPRFAMCLGFVFLSTAAIVLVPLAGFVPAWIGWAFTLAVSGLALLAAATDVCVGCELYVRIQRWTASETGGAPA